MNLRWILIALVAATFCDARVFDHVAVFVDYNAFLCNNTFSDSSSGSGSGSAHGGASGEPIVFLQHGPHGGTWHYLPMTLTWWNTSLVSAVIPSTDEFVVLCVGSFVHCDPIVQPRVGDTPIGSCVFNSYSNFRVTGETNSVLVVPSNASVVTYGVLIPFCPMFESIWSSGVTRPPSYFFTASGANANIGQQSNAEVLATSMPCGGGNGLCAASFIRRANASWSTSATCLCKGQWGGGNCTTCNCEPAKATTGYCVASSSGGCTSSLPSTASAGWSQGVSILLVATEWFGTVASKAGSYVRLNAGNITTNSTEWSNWNFTAVDPTDPRWGAFDATPYAEATNLSPSGTPKWMSAVVPGNLLQFVWYNEAMTDFVHCSTSEQLMRSLNSNASALSQHWGDFQCTKDRLNGLFNFASSGGVVAISQTSFSLVDVFEPGCQFGLALQQTNTSDSPQSSLAACSGHGACGLDTYFRCECDGNFAGVACETCTCGGGSTCTSTGECQCPAGYDNCTLDGTTRCLDVQTNKFHCGGCGNDCTLGLSSAIKEASCVDGVCHVVMQPSLEWEVCFGNMSAGGTGDATVAVGCFRGYDFLVVFCCAFPLFVASLIAFVRLRMTCHQSHMYRQALFLLIALISCLRMSYAVAALIFLGTASTPEAAVRSREFFSATMISLNAYADLFTGFIDLLLTVYWLFVLDRVRVFPKRLLISVCAGMSVVLTVATIVDYASGTSTFDYTFFTLAILLFFTALMHMSVIAEVLLKFVVWSRTHKLIDQAYHAGNDRDAETEPSFKGSFPAIRSGAGVVVVSPSRGRIVSMGSAGASITSTYGSSGEQQHHATAAVTTPKHNADQATTIQNPHLSGSITSDQVTDAALTLPPNITGHFVRVTLIAFVCLLCWMVRSVMLLGRATRQSVFVEGALSFRSSTFTLLYLTLLTLFPCVLIAIIFLALSVDALRAATASPGTPPSDESSGEAPARSRTSRLESGYQFSPRRMSPRAAPLAARDTTSAMPTTPPTIEEHLPLLREEN